MINFNKAKLSLQDIYIKNLVNEVDKFYRKFVRKHGILLVIPLSGAKEKIDKSEYDTLFIDKGYVAKAISEHNDHILVPFLSSWGAFRLLTDENNKTQLLKCDNLSELFNCDCLSEWVDDLRLREDFNRIPINWKLRLNNKFICGLLKKDSESEDELWNDFKEFLVCNPQAQIQMFIVPPDPSSFYRVPYEGFETIKLEGLNTKEVFTIVLSRSDIFGEKLVTPGKEYIHYIDYFNKSEIQERIVEEKEPVEDARFNAIVECSHENRMLENETEEVYTDI